MPDKNKSGSPTKVVANPASLVSAVLERWSEPFATVRIIASADQPTAQGRSLDKEGKLWDVVIVEEGTSLNGRHYEGDVLAKAAPLFEGCNVYIHKFSGDLSNHLPRDVRAAFPNGVAGNLVGFIEGVKMSQVDGKRAMTGRLHVAAPWLRSLLKNLWEEGNGARLGLSIDVEGYVSARQVDGRPVKAVESITKVFAVDFVTHPAAGGRLTQLLESGKPTEGSGMNKDLKVKAVEFVRSLAPALLEGISDLAALSEQQIIGFLQKAVEALVQKADAATEAAPYGPYGAGMGALLREVLALLKAEKMDEAMAKLDAAIKGMNGGGSSPYRAPMSASATPPPAVDVSAVARSAAEAAVKDAEARGKANLDEALKSVRAEQEKQAKELQESRLRESRAVVKAKLAEANLPKVAKDKLAKAFDGKIVTEDMVSEAIKTEQDFLAELTKSGEIRGMGHMDSSSASIAAGLGSRERMSMAMDLLAGYEPTEAEKSKYAGVPRFTGIREAYVLITGDRELRCSPDLDSRIVEAVSSDFPNILGTSMTKRALQAYRAHPHYWRDLADVVPVSDFKAQQRTQWGGFQDLAVIPEDDEPAAFANPSERVATYTPQQRGRRYTLSFIAIVNDDLRQFRQIPRKIAEAAWRSLNKHVFKVLIGNVGGGGINTDTIYDGAVLYTGGHGNLGTGALNTDNLRDARIRMRKQTDQGGNEPLDLRAKFLWVPHDEEENGKVLVESEQKPGSANNDKNPNFQAVEVRGVPLSFLGDDANNWYLSADKAVLPGIELGFVQGREEPQIVAADGLKEGDFLRRRRMEWFIWHDYGAGITEHRAFQGNIVP